MTVSAQIAICPRHLPFRAGAAGVSLLVTTIEFLERPGPAVAEAVRVARCGLVRLVLNRWSLGGLSRRMGRRARGVILGAARDITLFELRRAARAAAGGRLPSVRWASSLFPDGLWAARWPVPLGDVLGMAVALSPGGRGYPRRGRRCPPASAPGACPSPSGGGRPGPPWRG